MVEIVLERLDRAPTDGCKIGIMWRTDKIKNNIDLLLSETRHSPDAILRVCKRLSRTYEKASKTLSPVPGIVPMQRLSLACAFYAAIADGVDPDLSYLSEKTGIPRTTLHRWFAPLAEIGQVELVADGRRKILVVNRPGKADMVEMLDYIADYHDEATVCPCCGTHLSQIDRSAD